MLKKLAVAAALVAACNAHAQSGKTTRIVVGFPPGQATDLVARLIAERLGPMLGENVIVENKPGQGGSGALAALAKSPPDGAQMVLAPLASMVVNPHLYKNVGYDTLKDFEHVALVADLPLLMVANPSVPVKNLPELIAYAKANPDKLNFAISGVGGAPHLAGIEFAARTGVKWAYIPYKGGAPAVADTVGGQANVVFNGMLATWPAVTGGKLRALAVTSAQRVSSAPDTPTVAETLPGFETGSFQGVVGPAGIPRDIVARLNAEFAKAVNTPESKERLAKQGTEVRTGTPEQFGEFIRSDMARWAKVVKESGAKFD